MVGSDVDEELGYKIHMVYGLLASPSEKAYATINDSPEALSFSWDINSTPVPVTDMAPTSLIVADSTKLDATQMKSIEDILYGATAAPKLPSPDEIIDLVGGP
jgi:hypothetical protein